jgi:hypothetical protein
MTFIVRCPRCNRAMDSALVVCLPCYRATNRLSEDPGIEEFAYHVTVWDAARVERHPEYRPSTSDTGIFTCEADDDDE